jgi:hypothetical protein
MTFDGYGNASYTYTPDDGLPISIAPGSHSFNYHWEPPTVNPNGGGMTYFLPFIADPGAIFITDATCHCIVAGAFFPNSQIFTFYSSDPNSPAYVTNVVSAINQEASQYFPLVGQDIIQDPQLALFFSDAVSPDTTIGATFEEAGTDFGGCLNSTCTSNEDFPFDEYFLTGGFAHVQNIEYTFIVATPEPTSLLLFGSLLLALLAAKRLGRRPPCHPRVLNQAT